MNRKMTRILTAIIIAVSLIMVMPGCGKKKEEAKELPKTPVKMSVLKNGTIDKSISFTGTIKSDRNVDVFSQVSGKIQSITVKEGNKVNKGDLLIRLDNRDMSAQLAQAKAAYKMALTRLAQAKSGYNISSSTTSIAVEVADKGVSQAREAVNQARSSYRIAELDYNRMTGLYSSGAISKQALDQATTQYEVAKSRLEAAKSLLRQAEDNKEIAKANTQQNTIKKDDIAAAEAGIEQAAANVEFLESSLAKTYIYAPISGTVTLKSKDPGEIVSPGDKTPILNITDNNDLYLEANISESEIGGIREGDSVNIKVGSLGNSAFVGKVEAVIPTADLASRSFRIKTAIHNHENLLKDGMSATATMVVGRLNGIVVPRHWLKRIEGDYYVVKVDDKNRASFHKVSLGFDSEEKALITKGVAVNDRVVSSGQEGVRDGDIVDVRGVDDKRQDIQFSYDKKAKSEKSDKTLTK